MRRFPLPSARKQDATDTRTWDLKIGYALFNEYGICYARGSFQLDDYASRRAFAMRANEANKVGHEVRTWNYLMDPQRYAEAFDRSGVEG
jgi:hypothetical protein